MSVVMKALVLFPAAKYTGQRKWILLHRSKRILIDFERIDQPSRGPLDCFNLIWRRDTVDDALSSLYVLASDYFELLSAVLRLGLIMTVMKIAVDPFSQQLLQLHTGIPEWL